MTTLNSRLQLAMLNRKREKKLAEKGFTLIELLITVVILGALSAIALPNFLGVKDSATAKAQIASATTLAKECHTSIQAGLSTPTQTAPAGVAINTACGASGASYEASGLKPEVGLPCVRDLAATGDAKCTVNVNSAGAVSGTWS